MLIAATVFSIVATGKTVAAPVDSLAALDQARTFLGATDTPRRSNGGLRLHPFDAGRAAYGFTDGTGRFVILAADDRLPSVIGYGTAGAELPPALAGLLRLCEQQLATAPATRAAAPRSTTAVAPLLRSVRHQKAPFNRSCPYYVDDSGNTSAERCVVGCVATALEQVLSYYRRPATLADTVFAHSSAHFTTTDVAPGTPIDWANILERYAEGGYTDGQARAVADLSLWCGQLAEMNWGLSESGAYVSKLASSVGRALGYGYVRYADSYKYTPDDWMRMLTGEIGNGRPVLYAGSLHSMGAHAFVLDGLDAEGRFHVNWGYGGDYDGYFRLDILNPFDTTATSGSFAQAQGFFCNQEALLLHPDRLDVSLPDTLARTGQELRVTSLRFERRPDLNGTIAVRLGLRNTADTPLTTPIALLTHAPGADAPFDGADFLGYTGVRLGARRDTVVTAYAAFHTAGRRALSLSADGETLFYTQPLDVDSTATADVEVASIDLRTTSDSVVAAVTFSNAATAGWSGHTPTFSLFEGSDTSADGEPRRYALLNLGPGADTTVVVGFGGLRPSTAYTFGVRLAWPVVAQQSFVTPAATGIALPRRDEVPAQWFTPDGRRIDRPRRPGIYLKRQGRETYKVAWPDNGSTATTT